MTDGDRELIAARLTAIAGIAQATAMDVKAGRLWEGDLDSRVGQIHEQLRLIPRERQ